MSYTTITITVSEAKVMAELLAIAGDEFTNHICNDFSLSALGLTKEEMTQLDKNIEAWNSTPEEHNPDADHSLKDDWILMHYLSDMLKNKMR